MSSRSAVSRPFSGLPSPTTEGHGRFRPRTGLLRTIGSELISSEVVAIIELVRNCYDADATDVEIVFESPESPDRATIEIRDNGHGMSRDVLLGPWLEPATDHKSGIQRGDDGGDRSPQGRRRLGSKGVGRFAAQRLGKVLEVRTRTTRMQGELIALFDWSVLEASTYLDEVRIPWREGNPLHIASHGTHLAISQLLDKWTPERFDRLRLGLSRLVNPVKGTAFRIRTVINGAVEEISPALNIDVSMYSIRGRVDESGSVEISYSDMNGDSEQWHRSLLWPSERAQQCGPFEFRINAWDLDRVPLEAFMKSISSSLGLREFRKVIRDHSGVSLYRDGFRVLPYGEPGNDWLRLDSRRVNNPTMRLSNSQIQGAIHLAADANPGLRDQTNREGLVDTEAYEHLVEVVRELLGYLEARRFAARRAMDVTWFRKTSSLPQLHNDDTNATLDKLVDGLANGRSGSADEAAQLRQHIRDFRESTAETVRHYAGLATVGQMSSLVVGQLKHPIRQIRSELNLALGELDQGGPASDEVDDATVAIRSALQQLGTMEKRLALLDPLAIGGRGRRITHHNIAKLVTEVLEPFRIEATRLGVTLSIEGDPTAEVQTNREVFQQVLANLLENAIWFAVQGSSRSPHVLVLVNDRGFTITDNGPGVSDSVAGSIFEPHFSTRDDAHGLGLTLSRDLLRSIGGRIVLTATRPATFLVEFATA